MLVTRVEEYAGNATVSRVGDDQKRSTHSRLAVIALFVFNAVLLYPVFFPSLNQINAWDQARDIDRGRKLVEGVLPAFATNPAVAGLYALTYLPFARSPEWLVQTDALARFLLFGLLWVPSFAVARKLAPLASPLIMMAFVAISPVVVQLLANGSDALFASMSGFALWQFLSFRCAHRPRHLAACSAFVGLAAMSRPEGSLLLLVFLALSIAECLPLALSPANVLKHAVFALVPFFVLVGGYMGVESMRTEGVTLRTAQRSYTAFEQGHGIAFASSYGTLNAFVEGQKDARRLFGTPEENNYSVLRAIRRNPPAYFRRIPRLAYAAFVNLVQNYHWHFAVFCFAFAARGILALLLGRSYLLLATLLVWPASSLLHVLILFHGPHLLIPFVNVFALAAIGVTAAARNLDNPLERRGWVTALLALTALGVAAYRGPNDLLLAPLMLLGALWLAWLAAQRVRHDASARMHAAYLVLLAAALFVRFGVVHAAVPTPGSSPDEQATKWMRDHFPTGTRIGSYAPGAIFAANMEPVTNFDFGSVTNPDMFWAWMARERIQAIYVDSALRTLEPVAWQTIRSQIGHGLDVVFDKAAGAPTVDWHNAMFHSRPPQSEPVQVLVRAPSGPQ
jgi:hypothetical protein